MGLPGAGWAKEDHILFTSDEVQGGEVGDQVPFQAAGMIKVELLDALASWEPGGPNPVLAAVGVPGGDLALQTGRQVFLMRPGFAAGPFGEPARGLPQAGRLQRPRQIGNLGGHIPGGGFGAGHHATSSSNPAIWSAVS
jgi:hypothetical protein